MSRNRPKVTSDALPKDVSHLRGWRRARQVADVTKTKLPTRRITINLDADLVAIFKAEAQQGGPPYQVAINQALRSYLRERERSRREQAATVVLEEKAPNPEAVLASTFGAVPDIEPPNRDEWDRR